MTTNNTPLDEYRRQLVARYRQHPAQYRDHVAGLDAAALQAPIKPGEWSPHQLLFHVRAVDVQAYGPRLERILNEARPPLDDFDEAAWMAEHYDSTEDLSSIVDTWAGFRQGIAELLKDLPADAWNRTGLQPYWGERTLQWWLERAVTHAEDHWSQLLGE
ncbi:MAG TPA: DinB family protein [Anaerolineales bacterium]|nr:DinB family protein [Anaerolineales bacterium]